jgi:hypothetical protein
MAPRQQRPHAQVHTRSGSSQRTDSAAAAWARRGCADTEPLLQLGTVGVLAWSRWLEAGVCQAACHYRPTVLCWVGGGLAWDRTNQAAVAGPESQVDCKAALYLIRTGSLDYTTTVVMLYRMAGSNPEEGWTHLYTKAWTVSCWSSGWLS